MIFKKNNYTVFLENNLFLEIGTWKRNFFTSVNKKKKITVYWRKDDIWKYSIVLLLKLFFIGKYNKFREKNEKKLLLENRENGKFILH